MSPSGSVAVAAKDTASGATPEEGVAVAVETVGAAFAVGATPQAADGSTPAAISMPAPMWDRMPASANEACVWPRPVYHERPPS